MRILHIESALFVIAWLVPPVKGSRMAGLSLENEANGEVARLISAKGEDKCHKLKNPHTLCSPCGSFHLF